MLVAGDDRYVQCIAWDFMLGPLTEDFLFSFLIFHHQIKPLDVINNELLS